MIELPKLSEKEFEDIFREANGQQLRAKHKNYRETFKPKDDATSLNQTFNSLAAELALAKYLGFSSANDHTTFSGPDIGHWVQVKWIPTKDLKLVVPKKRNNIRDPRSFAYALVYGNREEGYFILGWLGGDLVCNRDPYSLRKDADLSWNVPQKELSQDWRMLQLIATSSAP